MNIDFWSAVQDSVNPGTWTGAAIYALLMGLVAWLSGRALRLAVHRMLEKQGQDIDQTAVRFVGQLARVGVWIFAFVCYAYLIPALNKLGTTWLASVGVISVVVGMAAQNTLGNLIAGISLVLYRPFELGDVVQVAIPGGLETGVVESINLGYTILRAGDERRLVIPNSVMASQTCVNYSMLAQRAACVVAIILELDADVNKAREILLELAAQHPKAIGTPGCAVTAVTGAGVTVSLTAWAAHPLTAPAIKCDILESAVKKFNAAGIKIHRDP